MSPPSPVSLRYLSRKIPIHYKFYYKFQSRSHISFFSPSHYLSWFHGNISHTPLFTPISTCFRVIVNNIPIMLLFGYWISCYNLFHRRFQLYYFTVCTSYFYPLSDGVLHLIMLYKYDIRTQHHLLYDYTLNTPYYPYIPIYDKFSIIVHPMIFPIKSSCITYIPHQFIIFYHSNMEKSQLSFYSFSCSYAPIVARLPVKNHITSICYISHITSSHIKFHHNSHSHHQNFRQFYRISSSITVFNIFPWRVPSHIIRHHVIITFKLIYSMISSSSTSSIILVPPYHHTRSSILHLPC